MRKFVRKKNPTLEKKRALEELEVALELELDLTLPRWAYTREEWNEKMVLRAKLRNSIKQIKRVLSSSKL